MPDVVNIGSGPNAGDGIPLRAAFHAVNAEFASRRVVKTLDELTQAFSDGVKKIAVAQDSTTTLVSELACPQDTTIEGPGTIFISPAVYGRGLILSSGCTVNGVKFVGNGSQKAVDNAVIGGHRGIALAAINASNVKIKNCVFSGFVSQALNTGYAIVSAGFCNAVDISENYFDSSNDGFIDIDCNYSAGDCVFHKNISYSNSDLFINLASVQFENIPGTEFARTANHAVIGNIHIKNRWLQPSGGRLLGRHGIAAHYAAGRSNLVIQGNIIGNVSRHGIYLRGHNSFDGMTGPDLVISNFLLHCGLGEETNYCSAVRVETRRPTKIAFNHIEKTGFSAQGAAGSSPAYDVECVRGTQNLDVLGNTMMGGKNGAVHLVCSVQDRSLIDICVKDNVIESPCFGVFFGLLSGTATVMSGLSVKNNRIKLTGSSGFSTFPAFGVGTECPASNGPDVSGILIDGNLIEGLGKSGGQWGVACVFSSASGSALVNNRAKVRGNTFRLLSAGVINARPSTGVDVPVLHRQIGANTRISGNTFDRCAVAVAVRKSTGSVLAFVSPDNAFSDCDAGAPVSSFGYYPSTDYGNVFIGSSREIGASTSIEFCVDAAPSSQDYVRGDSYFVPLPAAGGFSGGRCVATGSPGTWRGYGAIEP